MTKNAATDYYKIPLEDDQIIFVNSESTCKHLFDRLFENNNNEEIVIGFDCKLFTSDFFSIRMENSICFR